MYKEMKTVFLISDKYVRSIIWRNLICLKANFDFDKTKISNLDMTVSGVKYFSKLEGFVKEYDGILFAGGDNTKISYCNMKPHNNELKITKDEETGIYKASTNAILTLHLDSNLVKTRTYYLTISFEGDEDFEDARMFVSLKKHSNGETPFAADYIEIDNISCDDYLFAQMFESDKCSYTKVFDDEKSMLKELEINMSGMRIKLAPDKFAFANMYFDISFKTEAFYSKVIHKHHLVECDDTIKTVSCMFNLESYDTQTGKIESILFDANVKFDIITGLPTSKLNVCITNHLSGYVFDN